MISKDSVRNDILEVLNQSKGQIATESDLKKKLAVNYSIEEVESGIEKLIGMDLIERDENSDNLRIPENQEKKAREKLEDYFKNF